MLTEHSLLGRTDLSFSLFPDGSHPMMWKETDRTIRKLEKFNKADSKAYLGFGLWLRRFVGIVTPYLLNSPPERPQLLAEFEAAGEQRLFNEFSLLSVRATSSTATSTTSA